MGDPTTLAVGATLRLSVEGTTEPLVGSEEVLQAGLHSQLALLLERRGFQVAREGSQLVASLKYRTSAVERTNTSLTAKQSHVQFQSSGGAGSMGYGVAIAAAVARAASASSSSVTQSSSSSTVYKHVVALDICDSGGTNLWKGESAWESGDPDMRRTIGYALRLLCAELPTKGAPQPVPALKPDRFDDFLNLEVRDCSFTSPALPNRVEFYPASTRNQTQRTPSSVGIPIAAEDRFALPAILDLLEMAEYAVPNTKVSWTDPTNPQLWRYVTLGGRYLVGDARQPVRVLVKLTGSAQGYKVTRCWLAEDAEYVAFLADLKSWRQRLEEFYDVYE